jgi:hydrogenase maturation protein HypF
VSHVASLPKAAPARVLACGAYLKNTACLIQGQRVVWSALHGDLINAGNREALDGSVEQLLLEATGPVQAIAHDLHPDMYSSHVALALADRLGIPAIAVQHHHAHIAVVQAEQAVEGPVIGLALDGVGLGEDGSAWGGEVLWVDSFSSAQRWRRVDHLAPILLPGGDTAAREPWRMAAAVLHGLGRGDEIEARFGPLVGAQAARLVRTLMERQVNSPSTTSAGRWFDAAAGALGLCLHQRVEAEAAMLLEEHASQWLEAHPEFDTPWTSLELAPLVAELFAVVEGDIEQTARGAALFHLGLVNGLADRAIAAARRHGTKTVVLGGGCFFNKVLSERLSMTLADAGVAVLRPQSVGCGDAGLALGQAWVAACTVEAGLLSQSTVEV